LDGVVTHQVFGSCLHFCPSLDRLNAGSPSQFGSVDESEFDIDNLGVFFQLLPFWRVRIRRLVFIRCVVAYWRFRMSGEVLGRLQVSGCGDLIHNIYLSWFD
jgi:hypothetical protein